MKVLRLLSLLCIIQIPLLLCAQTELINYQILSENEAGELQNMLLQADLVPEHTKFYRDWDPYTRLKSDWHMAVLEGGLDAPARFAALRELMAEEALTEQINHFFGVLRGVDCSISATAFAQHTDIKASYIKRPKDIFSYMEDAYRQLEAQFYGAFSELSFAQLDTLKAFAMQAMIEEEDSTAYKHYFKTQHLPWMETIDTDRIAELLELVDWGSLNIAAQQYMIYAQSLRKVLPDIEFTNKKPIYHKSKWGLMVIGTKADDHYSPKRSRRLAKEPLCLLIDPAGQDIYDLPFITTRNKPFYLLLDLAGDDLYRSAQPSFFSLMGLGLSFDDAGNDLYQLGDFSFATALGSGIHQDSAGDDHYIGGLFSQGAALAGINVLCDLQGNDVYSAHSMSQAFGSVLGAGVLADYAGADLYYLGGKYLHAPLMPQDYRSMGQGMGFGMRPAMAGGLGFLYDKAGNDKYLAGVYAQGVGYWYSTGVLIDESGNDVYNAIYYPQGSGIHMASGFLYDHEGDDAYYSRNGPGQGAGHDWSFGILVDAAGNDAYSIHGGNGLGLSNSLAVFVDKSGNDRYERNEAQNYGNGAFSRSTGSIGLFLDAGGKDLYAEGVMANDSTWVKGKYGIGRDLELNILPEAEKETEAQLAPPAEDAPIDEVFAAAAEWEVGSAINRVRKAREIMAARADEMRPYILEHKLSSDSGLEYRAIDAFARADQAFQSALLTYVNAADSLQAKNAISLLAGLKDMELLPLLETHLAEGRYLASCISALANLESEAGLRLLLNYSELENERLRFLVLRSIAAYKSDEAKRALQGFEADESFLIQALIRNLPKDTP